MALWERGEGILGTHVPWEEIQERLYSVFGEKAVMGPKKEATNIGAGRGFMSRMCLIDPDWTGEQGNNVPKKFVIKICSQLAMQECHAIMKDKDGLNGASDFFSSKDTLELFANAARKIHNAEVVVYNLLKNHEHPGLPHPKIYYSQAFSEENTNRGYLIMSFIDGAENLNVYDEISTEDVKQALKAIASFEAVTLSMTEEEKKPLLMNPFVEFFAPILSKDTVNVMILQMRRFGGERLSERLDQFAKIVEEIMDMEWASNIGKELGMEPVLVHGDLWSTNLLWKPNDDNSRKLLAVVDFQTTHIGIPSVDLVRVMNACLSGEDRRNNWEHLSEVFYGYLEEAVADRKMPYTLEQLKESIRRFIPMGGLLLVPMIGPMLELNSSNPDHTIKEKATENSMLKCEALLDDIIEYHARNQEIKKKANGSTAQ